MRNFVSALLVLALLIPALLPVAPHEAVHAMYDAHILHQPGTSHQKEKHHVKFHSEDECFYVENEDVPHHIPTDLASYYSDFLHIDLKNADQHDLASNLNSSQDFDYDLDAVTAKNSFYQLKSLQKRGPPHDYVFKPDFSNLYLTNLSLLI